MSFKTDKQTLDELNLLGKFRQGSVYHLFNRVKTRGGEKLLDELFRQPLVDEQAINQRSSVFRFFQEAKLDFPWDALQVSLMGEYLDTGAKKSSFMVLLDVLVRKTLAGLTRDERYKRIVQGLQATIVTLQKCAAFLELLPPGPGVFEDRILAVKSILAGKQIRRLLETDIYQSLPVRVIASYEHVLKNDLSADMQEILRFIYEVDVHIAVSTVAQARGFTYAWALPGEGRILSASDLRHPCLEGAVGNDILLNEDRNLIFLTGANMAGKSTLMKSVGIGLYLAQMGFPVAASEFEFSVREGMYSSINVADNIGLGYSHFYAEVVRVKQAAEAAASGSRLLLMFDELFKGTNVKDAYDGTLAVTEAFAEYSDCLFVVSTHIIEVGEALRNSRNIQFSFMPTVLEGSRPRYTYRLQEGITEDRQGMMIIRNEGILELLDR